MPDESIQGPLDEYDELQDLVAANGGRVSAEDVWERAQDPGSTFHRHITWDEGEAAKKYQLQQCGALIRKFKMIRNVGGRTIKVDAFVKVPDSTDGYVPVQQAMTMEWVVQHRRIQLIASMERLAEQLRHWDEFSVVAEAITEALATSN